VNAAADDVAEGSILGSPFLDLLPIAGVTISVLNRQRKSTVIYSSGATASRLEEIHFDLGDGPLFDCVADAHPVLIPDISAADHWPLFLSRAQELGVGGVFVFPLTLGAASVGAAVCHTTAVGALDEAAVGAGSALGRAIAGPALRLAIRLAGDDKRDDDLPIEMRRQVHQATGMVILQLDVSATDALARMRAYAFSNGISLREVARDVVLRDLDFSAVQE